MILPPSSVELAEAANEELLDRFTASGDEAAFAELLSRHGAMVLAVCQRTLRHRQDVEDAFQATFLVLARSAGKIRRRQAIASWLYGVAYRVALRAHARRQRRRETPLDDRPLHEPDTLEALALRHARELLDEELSALPEQYREPMVLHCLLGKTCAEVAEELGLSVSAVEGRLKRGRNELRMRLARRGVALATLPAAWASLGATAKGAGAAPLGEATVAAAMSADRTGSGLGQGAWELARWEIAAMKSSTMTAFKVAALALGAAACGLMLEGRSNEAPGQEGPRTLLASPADASPGESHPAVHLAQANTSAATEADPKDKAAAPGAGRQGRFDLKVRSPNEEKIEAALDAVGEGWDFVDQPLAEVMDFIAEQYDIPIQIDQRALDDMGIDLQTPITRTVKSIPLRSLLGLVLENLDLDYAIKHDVLLITTLERAESHYMETRVYDLRRLSSHEPEEIARVVPRVVAVHMWSEIGGSGEIEALPASLVIYQTRRVHEMVNDFLLQLERHEASN